ncbi:MAG TPA: hypothetical protein VGP80_02835 [Gemmatimonadales bacterium]|jgi:hypothetical protein|nr:hypothetical protein [Gemmatimonadales bacterium]
MGFSAIPPKMDTTLLIPTLTLASQHSDAGLIQLSIPWDILLADTAAATEVRIVRLPLVNYYRGSGKKIVVALDVTNGLDRSAEDPALVALGRSITDTMVQRLYREYVNAVDTILHPDYMSLAAETNLVRDIAPASLYSAVVTMTNAAAAELNLRGTSARLMVSVQVETAWGALQGTHVFEGIAQDRTDFPFLEALGLSSYPYLGGYATPADVPDNYYSRLVASQPLPVVVLEGGWPSVSIGGLISTPAVQAQYIRRQSELLDNSNAKGVFQITFTDLNPSPFPPGLSLFANLGLVDTVLVPKPALATWDSILARPLH